MWPLPSNTVLLAVRLFSCLDKLLFAVCFVVSPLHQASSPILLIYNTCLPLLSRRCEIANELETELISKAAIIRDHYL